ncbi:hypothetical protein QYZ88_009640 [Lachnospiraceae bacterium C1.1]|nr:hypothetical protein [Lachnospiraceae bacterium C1.1]
MKKGVLRVAAVVLFAAVIFINISHGHVKAFQGKDSGTTEEVSVIDGDGVLADSGEEEKETSSTIENLDQLTAGAGSISTKASKESKSDEKDINVPEKTDSIKADPKKDDKASSGKTVIKKEEITSVAEADINNSDAEISDKEAADSAKAESEANITDADIQKLENDNTEASETTVEADPETEVLAGRSEPKTAGKDVPIVIFAVFALLADFFLVLIDNAHGMTEEDKANALKKIKAGIHPGSRISLISAYIEVFNLLLYYHLIGKYIKRNKKYA